MLPSSSADRYRHAKDTLSRHSTFAATIQNRTIIDTPGLIPLLITLEDFHSPGAYLGLYLDFYEKKETTSSYLTYNPKTTPEVKLDQGVSTVRLEGYSLGNPFLRCAVFQKRSPYLRLTPFHYNNVQAE